MAFRYFQQPLPETQRKPVLPHQIISGGLPGSTVLRIGGDSGIKISGVDRAITITDTEGNSLRIGVLPSGKLGISTVTDQGLETVRLGQLPDQSWGIAGANEGFDLEDGFE